MAYGSGPGADTLGIDLTYVTDVNGVTIDPLNHVYMPYAAEIAGDYGTLKMTRSGKYEYVLDENNTEVHYLAEGETLSEVFTYTITDKDGDSSTTTLTITIDGTGEDDNSHHCYEQQFGGGYMMLEPSALMLNEEAMNSSNPDEHDSDESDPLDLSELISDTNVSKESLSDYLAFIEDNSDETHDDSDHSQAGLGRDGSQVTSQDLETIMVLEASFDDQDEAYNGDYLNE